LLKKWGIERASKSIQEADLILFVLDSSAPLTQEDKDLITKLKDQKVLVLWNKSDLKQVKQEEHPFKETLQISAQSGNGLDLLYRRIPELLNGRA